MNDLKFGGSGACGLSACRVGAPARLSSDMGHLPAGVQARCLRSLASRSGALGGALGPERLVPAPLSAALPRFTDEREFATESACLVCLCHRVEGTQHFING